MNAYAKHKQLGARSSDDLPPLPYVHYFPRALWAGPLHGARPGDWEALYVDAYMGPRDPATTDTHGFWELSVVLQGEGRFLGNTSLALTPNLCILVPPGVAHNEFSRDESFRTLWIGFRTRALPDRPSVCLTLEHAGLADMAQDLWLFSREQGKAIGPELDARVALLVLRFLRLRDEAATRQGADRVSRAIAWLEDHYSEPMSVRTLAEELHCSEGYLHRCFQKRTGTSPGDYLRNLRIHQACFLLHVTRFSIQDIGERVGYPEPAYFSRVFKVVTGRSPNAFRKEKKMDSRDQNT